MNNVKILIGTHPYDTPPKDIDLEEVLVRDSFLNTLESSDDIKMIPRNFDQCASCTITYNADVLIVEDEVNSINLAKFNNVNTLVSLTTKVFPSIKAFKSMNIKKAIFINASFLKGRMFLLEGCTHIIKNFNEFNDKENFIKYLKVKKVIIDELFLQLIELSDEVIVKFLLDNELLNYEHLITSLKFNLSTTVNAMLLSEIQKVDPEEKSKYETKVEYNEQLDLGLTNYTIKDLAKNFRCKIEGNKVIISKYIGKDETIFIPRSVDGISNYEFKNLGKNDYVTSIVFEEGISSITTCIEADKHILKEFIHLKKIIFPTTLKFIDEKFFNSINRNIIIKSENSNNEEYLLLKDNMLIFNGTLLYFNYEDYFKEHNSTNVIIPNNIVNINHHTFQSCPLTSISIPNTVTIIERYTFFRCDMLETVSFEEGLLEIRENAFDTCITLKNISIPNSVKVIADNAFCVCFKLRNIILPDSLVSFGNRVFSLCEIKSIEYSENYNQNLIKLIKQRFKHCELIIKK